MSALADLAHPFSRFLANTDTAGHAVPLVGALPMATNRRRRACARRSRRPDARDPATVTLKDPDFPDATDGLGWLESGNDLALQTVTVTPDIFQRAIVYYRPPAVFVRMLIALMTSRDWTAPSSCRSSSPALEVEPSAFSCDGRQYSLFMACSHDEDVERAAAARTGGGLPVAYAPTKGFDGRFDVFAVGNPNVSGTVVEEAAAVKEQIKLSSRPCRYRVMQSAASMSSATAWDRW